MIYKINKQLILETDAEAIRNKMKTAFHSGKSLNPEELNNLNNNFASQKVEAAASKSKEKGLESLGAPILNSEEKAKLAITREM